MKVKDLIEELERLDQDAELEFLAKVRFPDPDGRRVKVDRINSVPHPTIILSE